MKTSCHDGEGFQPNSVLFLTDKSFFEGRGVARQ